MNGTVTTSKLKLILIAFALPAILAACDRTRPSQKASIAPSAPPVETPVDRSPDRAPNPQPVVVQPPGSRSFSISRLEATWSGPTGGDTTNHRTVMYGMKACVDDRATGKAAAGVEFTIQLADKTKITKTASSMKGLEGCVEWEDRITHFYYEPEHWMTIPVTISHASGYSETRDYVIAPWQRWNFTMDPVAKGDFIRESNARPRLPSRFLADGITFNTQNTSRYDVDEFLSMTYIKRVMLQIPMRVYRPSNIMDGINMAPEPLRPGRYLLKAAFVAPVQGVGDQQAHLLVSPMIGLNRIVTARGGSIYADVEFPLSDVRLMNARAYIAFELYLVDEEKIPKDDPFMTKPGADPLSVVDRQSQMLSPTFVGALNMKLEKDSSILVPAADLSLALPTTDPVYKIPYRDTITTAVQKAVEPLANVTVDSLYAMAKRDLDAYRARMKSQTSLGLVTDHANSEFAFVSNESTHSTSDRLLMTNNTILPPADRASGQLLKYLNLDLQSIGATGPLSKTRPNITRQSLLTLIRGRKEFDKALAAQLCGYFFYTLPRTKLTGTKWNLVEYGSSGNWAELCLQDVAAHSADSVFSVDHRVRVLETNGTQWVRGRSLDIHVGANVSFTQAKSSTQSWGFGFGTSGLMGELSKRALLAKQGSRLLKVFTTTAGALGVSAEVARSDASTTSVQGGAGFDIGQSLTVEQNEIRINVTKSDECVVIRPRPRMFTGRSAVHLKIFESVLGADEADKLMSRGLMLCTGAVDTTARSFPERYYTFGFKLVGGNATDAMNVANLPWLLSLRGQRDYASFLMMASAQNMTVKEAKGQELDLGDLATGALESVYDQQFAGKMSTIPGFITAEPKIIFRRKK